MRPSPVMKYLKSIRFAVIPLSKMDSGFNESQRPTDGGRDRWACGLHKGLKNRKEADIYCR